MTLGDRFRFGRMPGPEVGPEGPKFNGAHPSGTIRDSESETRVEVCDQIIPATYYDASHLTVFGDCTVIF